MLRKLPRLLPVLSALVLSMPADAASVVIWPVDPVIAADARAAALWIENKGPAPVAMQVRALRWRQGGGEDRLDQQDDVVVSPPLATIEPGRRQLVRIIRRQAGAGAGEGSYRLLVDELPPPMGSDQTKSSARLSIQMRYSVPLFTYGGAEGASSLRASVALEDGRRVLVVANAGSRHARLVDLRVIAGGRPTPVLPGLIGYVLPGSTMRWPLPADAPTGPLLVGVDGHDLALTPTA